MEAKKVGTWAEAGARAVGNFRSVPRVDARLVITWLLPWQWDSTRRRELRPTNCYVEDVAPVVPWST